jgi:hypothetical protein
VRRSLRGRFLEARGLPPHQRLALLGPVQSGGQPVGRAALLN